MAKPNHGPSKPIYHPDELRLAKLWLHWLKDVEGRAFEVAVRRSVPSDELFESVANLAYNRLELAQGHFRCYRFYDALGQLRNFTSHVEP